jgi:hypothetical protein
MATKIDADITVASTDIIDTQGAESLTYLLATINTTSVALVHGDDSALADVSDVGADFIIVGDSNGTVVGNDVGYTAATTAQIGYVGKKRYVKATITNAATDTTIVTVKGDLLLAPPN